MINKKRSFLISEIVSGTLENTLVQWRRYRRTRIPRKIHMAFKQKM